MSGIIGLKDVVYRLNVHFLNTSKDALRNNHFEVSYFLGGESVKTLTLLNEYIKCMEKIRMELTSFSDLIENDVKDINSKIDTMLSTDKSLGSH